MYHQHRPLLLAFLLFAGCTQHDLQPENVAETQLGDVHRVSLSGSGENKSSSAKRGEFVMYYTMHDEPYLVLWCDTTRCRNTQLYPSGIQKAANPALKLSGTLLYEDVDDHPAQEVIFSGSCQDGVGQVSIAGTTYDLSEGALLLVAQVQGSIEVKQLSRDLGVLKPDRQTLIEYEERDSEIRDFFAASTYLQQPVD